MRINKFIAKTGLCSRRKAEELILNGDITVNDIILNDLSYKVKPDDIVKYKDQVITLENKKVYYMLNKPVGYTSTNKDKFADKVIFELIDSSYRLFSIGRLDKDSRGLILLTNDGEMYNKIMHPRNEIFKKYEVTLNKKFNKCHIENFNKGIDIGGYITNKSFITTTEKPNKVYIEINEGKNRQVRKMFSALGYDVIDLNRVSIANIKLDQLVIGEYRELNDDEINYLMKL